MWMLVLPMVGIAAIAVAIAMAFMPSADERPRRKRARGFHPDQSGRWEGVGSERRNAK
jgi:hypothetical protein